MIGLSTNPGMDVKLKPPNFSALPNSTDPQLKKSPAFVLKYDIGIIDAKYEHRRIGLTARYILGIITAYLRAHPRGYLSEDKIAQAAGCCRATVSRVIAELKAVGYLDVDDSDTCNRYRICGWVKYLDKIWVKPSLVRDDGLSILQAVFVSYVKFRQHDNDATWFVYREAAESLGVSYHTIARAAASKAVLGFIERIHRPWKQLFRTEYYLTDASWLETLVFGPETARPKCGALGQTSRKRELFNAPFGRKGVFAPRFGLSFDCRLDREPYELLIKSGVNRFVAESAAAQWRSDPDSVRQALFNAAARGDDYHRRVRQFVPPARRFNLAGYAIATLNGAHHECHGVRPSKLARAAAVGAQGGARAAVVGRLPEAEFKRRQKELIRRLRAMPAKPTTPGDSAIPAEHSPIYDKAAGAEYLIRTLAAARRNSRSCKKWANQAQKLRFSDGPCS